MQGTGKVVPQNRASGNFMVIESGESRWDGCKQSTYQVASGKVMLYSQQEDGSHHTSSGGGVISKQVKL